MLLSKPGSSPSSATDLQGAILMWCPQVCDARQGSSYTGSRVDHTAVLGSVAGQNQQAEVSAVQVSCVEAFSCIACN